MIWFAWLQATGGVYLDDVIIPHLHYTTGMAPVDESYLASTSLMPADLEAYNRYCASPEGMARDIRKIAAAARVTGRQQSAEQRRAFNASLNIPERARQGWVPGEPLA